ncbi:MAG: septum formation protein Maf [Myxococcales bacterium]|nr:septum formation protein Maf [Myxococcales bacterium]
MSADSKLVLGSASPRRAELLRQLGLSFCLGRADVDETVLEGEPAEAYLERVTLSKLEAVAEQLPAGERRLLLVADTSVVCDERILGKPANAVEAFDMLALLVGREHRVMTCYRLGWFERELQPVRCHTETTWVAFRSCEERSLRRYAATGEGFDKAGGYAIQGIGSYLVSAIRGSYSNVVGLPTCALVQDLERLGLLAGFPA